MPILLSLAFQPDPTGYLTVDTKCLTVNGIVASVKGVVFSVCKSEMVALSLLQNPVALGPASTRTQVIFFPFL